MKIDRGDKENWQHAVKPLAIIDDNTIIFRDPFSFNTCVKYLKSKKYQLFKTDDRGRIRPFPPQDPA